MVKNFYNFVRFLEIYNNREQRIIIEEQRKEFILSFACGRVPRPQSHDNINSTAMFMAGVYRPSVGNEMKNESKILRNEMKNSFEKVK